MTRYPKQDEVDVVKTRLAEVSTTMLEDTSVTVLGFTCLEPMKHKQHDFKKTLKSFPMVVFVYFILCNTHAYVQADAFILVCF